MPVPIGPGIGIGTITGAGAPVPEAFFGDVLNGELRRRWPAMADALTGRIIERLGAANLIADGFTLYDIGVAIDRTAPTLSIARMGDGGLLVSCTTGRCAVVASSTQPTPFGKWADPRIRFTFALSFSFAVSIPTTTRGGLSVSPLRSLRILQPDIDSMSIITDIAFFIDDLIAFVRGRRFIEDIQDAIAQRDFAELVNGGFLTDALAPVNAALDSLWKRGFWYLESLVDTLDGTGQVLAMRMAEAPPGILTLTLVARALERTGIIGGTITWPKSLGRLIDTQARVMRADWSSSAEFVADTVAALRISDAFSDSETLGEPTVPVEDQGKTTVVRRETTPMAEATPLAEAITALSPDLRAVTITEMLGGSRLRLESLLGAPTLSRQLKEIVFGTDDLVIEASVRMPGESGQLFGGTQVASRLSALWAEDDDTTCRRHYRLTDVAVGHAVTLSVRVAPGHTWFGTDFSAAPEGWEGEVTVEPASEAHPPAARPQQFWRVAIDDTIAFRGGVEVMLNPQPLPPKESGVSPLVSEVHLESKEVKGVLDAVSHRALGKRKPVAQTEVSSLKAVRFDQTPVLKAALRRTNPTGNGLVEGIDFVLQPYQAPIVR